MRIISGRWRSRKIEWPTTGLTRPITDRVREALFDVLGTWFDTPGELPAISIADVFAGGGSLGIEALSRGAEKACFFERDRAALTVLRGNLDRLQAGPEAVIVGADLWRSGIRAPETHRPFGLVFVDPPFPDTRDLSNASKLGTLLRRLGSSNQVTAATLLVVRTEQRATLPAPFGKFWMPTDRREYGRNIVDLLEYRATEHEA
ncbi:MAG: RsmD family RNA methyltransferase [Phycisphaerales bacterium]|nr:RsmD family RNA methyltransferase [Phycisphaerales bacterium]